MCNVFMVGKICIFEVAATGRLVGVGDGGELFECPRQVGSRDTRRAAMAPVVACIRLNVKNAAGRWGGFV